MIKVRDMMMPRREKKVVLLATATMAKIIKSSSTFRQIWLKWNGK